MSESRVSHRSVSRFSVSRFARFSVSAIRVSAFRVSKCVSVIRESRFRIMLCAECVLCVRVFVQTSDDNVSLEPSMYVWAFDQTNISVVDLIYWRFVFCMFSNCIALRFSVSELRFSDSRF